MLGRRVICPIGPANQHVILQIVGFLVFAKNPEETATAVVKLSFSTGWPQHLTPFFLACFSSNKKYCLLLGVYGIAEPLVRIGNTLALDLAFKGQWLLQAGVPWLPDKPYRAVGAGEAEGALPSVFLNRGGGRSFSPHNQLLPPSPTTFFLLSKGCHTV